MLAQANNNSPYSQFGLGDLQPQAFIPQTGMGGIGVSNANGISIASINPALLVRNRYTVLDLGMVVQYKNLSNTNQSQQSVGGNLQYIALAFPVSQKWASGITLQPYSTINYKFTTSGYIQGTGTNVLYSYEGSGGLTVASFTNSVQVGKYVSLGLKASYLFGNTTSEKVSYIPINEGYNIASINRINYGDFSFKTGIAFRKSLKEKLYINAGGTYEFSNNLSSKRFSSVETRRSGLSTLVDTLSKNEKGNVKIPGQFQLGLSIDNPFHWMVGVDFSYYKGKDFRNFNGEAEYGQNGFTIAAGGEWTPNYNAVSGYFNRVTYKTGVSFSRSPLILNNKSIDDMNVNIGAVFPVGRGFSLLNVAFAAGQRGTLDNSLLKETYIRGNLGITINDRWFQKRKID